MAVDKYDTYDRRYLALAERADSPGERALAADGAELESAWGAGRSHQRPVLRMPSPQATPRPSLAISAVAVLRARICRIGEEKLVTFDFVGVDRLLPLRANDPVDELLAEVLLHV